MMKFSLLAGLIALALIVTPIHASQATRYKITDSQNGNTLTLDTHTGSFTFTPVNGQQQGGSGVQFARHGCLLLATHPTELIAGEVDVCDRWGRARVTIPGSPSVVIYGAVTVE